MRWMAAVWLFAFGCLHSESVQCEDGRICPNGSRCDLVHATCITDGQELACDGKGDGASCELSGRLGACSDGICLFDDLDGDGVVGARDNCPVARNADQMDRDGDGFGDACDYCPDVASAVNHDEDEDSFGDVCDLCPQLVDLQDDPDGDGVSTACDGGSQTIHLLAFDPFVNLGAWTSPSGTGWTSDGDSIAPATALALTDVGLVSTYKLATTDELKIDLGYTAQHAWTTEDRIGVTLLDDSGARAASLEIRCYQDLGCRMEGTFADGMVRQISITMPLRSEVSVRLKPSTTAGAYDIVSHVADTPFTPTMTGTIPTLSTVLAVSASPRIRLRYIGVWSVVN